MENKNLDLLNDIIKLLKKYGPDAFSDLSKFLKEEKFVETLADLINKISEEGKKQNIASKRTKPKISFKIREYLVALKESENEKAEILLDFYDKLYSQGNTLKLKDIKNYSSDIGYNLNKAKSKDDAISKLLKYLTSLSKNDIPNLLNQFKFFDNEGDRSLEGWSNIILKKDKN